MSANQSIDQSEVINIIINNSFIPTGIRIIINQTLVRSQAINHIRPRNVYGKCKNAGRRPNYYDHYETMKEKSCGFLFVCLAT